MNAASPRCGFVAKDGSRCEDSALEDGLCYWHSPKIVKKDPSDMRALEELARSGRSMEGFSLAFAQLAGVNLVRSGAEGGFDLTHADLYHADLTGAHLFHINLKGSSLMKADLTGASMNQANLEGTNLLGTVFRETKIEHTEWGERLYQEYEAERLLADGARDQAQDQLEQAEEIYRNLRKAAESRGQFENAGQFFYKEMTMRRRQLPRFSTRWAFSKLVDVFCGYGEKPLRVVLFSLAFILVCGICYAILGVNYDGVSIAIRAEYDFGQNVLNLLNCIYFSVVTFTTLGYGDLTPTGWARPLAAAEAFVGSFTLALFVVVFVKKMTR